MHQNSNRFKVQKIERKKTRRKKVGYSVRFVVSKVHHAEGTFLENKNFVSMSLGGSAPRDYAIQ